MIGNFAYKTKEGIEVVGFENHSGRTYLGKGVEPLGKMIKGCGNNGEDGTEGVRYKNTFGTYSHGPVLPKNPQLADLLISLAVKNKYGSCRDKFCRCGFQSRQPLFPLLFYKQNYLSYVPLCHRYKNPQLADLLISLAVKKKYGSCTLEPLDDDLEDKARSQVMKLYIK